jgi:hypothetical protein
VQRGEGEPPHEIALIKLRGIALIKLRGIALVLLTEASSG